MNIEPFGPELTAFALNDPSLTDAQKRDIEQRLATDPDARQFIEETRTTGQLLAEHLCVHVEPVEDSPMGHTVAATLAKKRGRAMLPWWAAAVAACVAFSIGIGVTQRKPSQSAYRDYRATQNAAPISDYLAREEHGLDSRVETSIDSTARNQKLFAKSQLTSQPQGMPGAPSKTMQGAILTRLEPGETFTIPGAEVNTSDTGKQTGDAGQGGIAFQNDPSKGRSYSITTLGTTDDPSARAVQLQKLYAQKGQLLVSGLDATHEKVKAVDAELRFLQERHASQPSNRDAYPQLIENAFTEVKGQDALSTFGVDVDTASYSIVRNYLNHNTLPPANAVRLEEMINYFPYKDAPPEGNDPFTARVEMAECPWQPKHRLARIALKAKPIDNSKRRPSNLVFLIDVSGSMNGPTRLPLVKAAMKLLVGQLGENDRVAIVVYAGASGLVLDSTNCGNPETILKALDSLTPGGSTNGASGIQLAYDVAVKNFIEKGTNRVILCTDGDWNVGTTGTDALIKLIEEKRKTGVFLSVFGFGMGNLRDEMMVQLAGKGNGNYGYIDSLAEAKKALVEQVSGTLVTVAKDVKIQIEFNPARIASFRLIGYEKRMLAAKDFADDKKDAGEMGAGHVVTALYELVPIEAAAAPKLDGLRYQPNVEAPKASAEDKTAKEAFVLKLRHKMPDKDESTLREIPVPDDAKAKDKASDDFQFASAVAAFGMLLKNSQYKAQANYALVEELVAASLTNDPGAYRAEFLQLVKKAKALSGVK